MRKNCWFVLAAFIFLTACQKAKTQVIILVDGKVLSQASTGLVPAEFLSSAGFTIGAHDRVLYQGSPVSMNSALPLAESYTLTIRRAVTITITSPNGAKTIQTSAFTVGEALKEAGFTLYTADQIDPPAETPLHSGLAVSYRPSIEVTISIDGKVIHSRSALSNVGQILAQAGVPLIGIDFSIPPEDGSLPGDGRIKVVRTSEKVRLAQKQLPFTTRTELSSDLEIDQQALVQGGEPGLAVTRERTRLEDGVQVSQKTESESLVRPAQDRIMGIGTKIVIRTTSVDGVSIEYWRTLHLFATSYSPCNSATPDGRCAHGSSSGLPVQKGIVAMVYYWYLKFGFEHVYIPGYGYAQVGDVGGGYQGSHYWIDLGYSDNDYVEWAQWVTVYFLAPVPPDPVYILP
jgi:resuscitation-promoting factor RpfB